MTETRTESSRQYVVGQILGHRGRVRQTLGHRGRVRQTLGHRGRARQTLGENWIVGEKIKNKHIGQKL
jgi:hypothetical protein